MRESVEITMADKIDTALSEMAANNEKINVPKSSPIIHPMFNGPCYSLQPIAQQRDTRYRSKYQSLSGSFC